MTKKEPEEKRKKRERKGAKAAAEGQAPDHSLAAESQGASPNAGAADNEAPAPMPPADEPPQSASTITPRRRGFLLLGAAAGVALVGWGIYELLGVGTESTDDAYVASNIVPITAREAGTVVAIRADNTQGVKAGDTLVELDPALVNVQMDAAEAALARAVRQVHAEGARLNASDGEVAEAESALATTRGDLTRRKAAAASGAVPAEDFAHASDALRHAEAALALAQCHRAEALAAVSGGVSGTDVAHNPAVLTAIAEIHRAAIAQGHMRITAPVDGVVAQRNVQIGEQIAGGTPLMAVVPLRDVWVEANFRETQLADLRIGQPVTLKADAWAKPWGSAVTFHGRVAGLSAGSGAAFALLPAQNASGNWIKVVQRLPVRIALDPRELDAHPLRIGLSVTVSVDTTQHAGAPVAAAPARAVALQLPQPSSSAVDQRIAAIISSGGAR